MRRVSLYISILILIACVGFFAGWHLRPRANKKDSLQVLGKIPDYTLTNQLGQQVSSKSFHGKVRVVTFLFPYCQGYCPLIAHNFVSLEQNLKASKMADKVQLVAFNVDPDSTGPKQMKAFQQQYGWNPTDTHWQYLTGKPGEIHHIVTGSYYIDYQRVSEASEDQEIEKEKKAGTYVPDPVVANKLADEAQPNYDIVHNDALAIVDTTGHIRKIFEDADRVSNQQIMDVIYKLLPSYNDTRIH
ncbi:MAG TPA: SCO family protein [Balneolales bacterium]|nr:SCO family protein [Balneolales bacterium]